MKTLAPPGETGPAMFQRIFHRVVRWPPLDPVAEPALTECTVPAYRRRKVCRTITYYSIGALERPAQSQLPGHNPSIDLTRST